MSGSGSSTKTREQDGPQTSRINNGVREDNSARGDANYALNLSHILGDEGATVGSICKTPP